MQVERILEAVQVFRDFEVGGRKIRALDRVDLAVAAGEFLVVTGPSGSGKSTLLNLLSGLDTPSGGEVRFHGDPLQRLAHQQSAFLRNASFGFMFQTPHLLADKTVLENVSLPFHYGGWLPPDKVRKRCRDLLDYVGMAELEQRYPATLSGGEMQRVVFARALAREPEIIFADEPTGSLDAGNSTKILDMLKRQTDQGRTVIMVTHDREAAEYGSTFLALRKVVAQEDDK